MQVITLNAECVISPGDNSRNDVADTYETGIMHKHGVRGMGVEKMEVMKVVMEGGMQGWGGWGWRAGDVAVGILLQRATVWMPFHPSLLFMSFGVV